MIACQFEIGDFVLHFELKSKKFPIENDVRKPLRTRFKNDRIPPLSSLSSKKKFCLAKIMQ